MNQTNEFREGLDELASHYQEILQLLGENPDREGLEKTPMRVAKAMQVLTRGYTQDPKRVLLDALFEEKYDQMVIVKDILLFFMRTSHAALLWKGTRSLHSSWSYHRTEQGSTRGRHIQSQTSGARTTHPTSERLHTRGIAAFGRDGCHRSKTHVYADARSRKTKFYHHNECLFGCFQPSKNT